MLDAVVESFLDSVTEREFDAPFMALLRSQGFTDIHLIHGAYEYGKDVIAKSAVDPPNQFAFQTKAGDINLGEWNSIRGQIDLLQTNDLAHPGFDNALPRTGVLVLTGRLVGGATLAVQDYQRYVRDRGETPLDVWDRERLVELLAVSADAALAGTIEGPLLELLGHIDSLRVTEIEIERFSSRWRRSEETVDSRSIIEASIVANRLRQHERLDLACFTTLALLRALWASVHDREPLPQAAEEQAELIHGLFAGYAEELWAACSDDLLTPRGLISADPAGLFVTYPVRCARLVELLGLHGLNLPDEERAGPLAEWVARFVESQPGAAHPISDRWAVSLIPLALFLTRHGHDAVPAFLREAVRWLGDRYENDGLGLATFDAEPKEEVEYLLGSALEHLERPRLISSYLAAVLLDLAAALDLSDVYNVAFNDISAVGAVPLVTLPNDDVSQYLVNGNEVNIPRDTSPRYAEGWERGDGWCMAPHHREPIDRWYLGRLRRPWDQLAVTLVTRDRHWVASLRSLAHPSSA